MMAKIKRDSLPPYSQAPIHPGILLGFLALSTRKHGNFWVHYKRRTLNGRILYTLTYGGDWLRREARGQQSVSSSRSLVKPSGNH
jgi:hypothetical protein